jgi:hypothetical protein
MLRTLDSIDIDVAKTRTDLDSHADQCAIGSNALVTHDFDLPINVSGCDPNGPITRNLRTVTAALTKDNAMSSTSIILVVHQAILMPDLPHNLLSTMQLQLNDVTVNDVPRFLTDDPTPLTHSLLIPTADIDNPYVIPLTLFGVASSFPTRTPTVTENEALPHIILTSEEPAYNPHDTSMAEHEDTLAKAVLETVDRIVPQQPRRLCTVSKTALDPAALDGTQLPLQTNLDRPRRCNIFCDAASERFVYSLRIGWLTIICGRGLTTR